MQQYSKAIAALITPLLLAVLLPIGITADTTVENAISAIIMALGTASAVYFVRNK